MISNFTRPLAYFSNRNRWRCTKALLVLCLGVLATPTEAASKLALIIDDIGARQADKAAFTLPDAVTLSFLPHTPWGREYALKAWQNQRQIMLHLPMATKGEKNPGPWAITPDLDQWQVKYRVKKAFADIPFSFGVNNHMGSAVTPDAEMMSWVMQELSKRDTFFVDSLTTPNSQAFNQAKANGLASIKRDVFLDPDFEPETIKTQWALALRWAKQRGSVLVIAHPHPNTLSFLEEALDQLSQQNIELVKVSSLIPSINQGSASATPALSAP